MTRPAQFGFSDDPHTALWNNPAQAPAGGYPGGPVGGPIQPGQVGSGRPGVPGGFAPVPAWAPPVEPPAGSGPGAPAPGPEPRPEAATPQVRNGRLLAAVLAAAVLILVIAFGIVWLVTKDDSSSFDPAVGECVKQEGTGAVSVDCADEGAYTVVSKVDDVQQCADPAQPHIDVPMPDGKRVFCLQPAAAG